MANVRLTCKTFNLAPVTTWCHSRGFPKGATMKTMMTCVVMMLAGSSLAADAPPRTMTSVESVVSAIPKDKLPPGGPTNDLQKKVLNDWLATGFAADKIKVTSKAEKIELEMRNGEKVIVVTFTVQAKPKGKEKPPIQFLVIECIYPESKTSDLAKITEGKSYGITGGITNASLYGHGIRFQSREPTLK